MQVFTEVAEMDICKCYFPIEFNFCVEGNNIAVKINRCRMMHAQLHPKKLVCCDPAQPVAI